ncbi:MAG: kelch repeat-containing protein, partial [Chloroflexota bacterium]
MPNARWGPGVATAGNGKIYVIGGYNSAGLFAGTVEEYDPVTDTWAIRASMPTPRWNAGAAAATNGKVYVIGGQNSLTAGAGALNAVEEYDPATNTWVARASMPTARHSFGVVAASNGKIYVIGGYNSSGFLATVEEYDPATDSWSASPSVSVARAWTGAAEANNGKIYLIGGWNGNNIAVTEEGQCSVIPTPTPMPTATPTVTPAPSTTPTPTPNCGLASLPTVIARIPVGTRPVAVAVNPTTNRIYVTNEGSDNVSVIDGATNQVVATVTVGIGPFGVGVNPATNRIYVANRGSDNVSVIDGNTNQVVATVTVGTMPYGLAVNPITNRIYVGNNLGRSVSVIDGASNSVVGTISLGGDQPDQGLAVNPVTNRIYVGNHLGRNISVIDGNTNSVVATVGVDGAPTGIGVDPLTNRVYVALWDNYRLSVIDGVTNTSLGTIWVGSCPVGVGVNPACNRIYVGVWGYANVAVVDSTTNSLLGTVGTGNSYGLALNLTTNRIYVTGKDYNVLSVLAYDLTLADTVPPVTVSTVIGTIGDNGWYRSDAQVTLTATDNPGGSGVKEIRYQVGGPCPVSETIVTGNTASLSINCEGTSTITYWAVDNAGSVEDQKTQTVRIDKGLPDVTASALTPPNANGWYNSPVTVGFICSDDGSGVASCPRSITLSSEGAGQSATGTAMDNAGNFSTATVGGINIDLTAPSISGAPISSPNSYGWYNLDVTVHFSASDALSGLASISPDFLLSAEGASLSATGAALDLAGNRASVTVAGINIDKTAPTISATLSPPPNAK